MIDKMRHDSSRAVIPGEQPILLEHLRKRKKQGVRMNIKDRFKRESFQNLRIGELKNTWDTGESDI